MTRHALHLVHAMHANPYTIGWLAFCSTAIMLLSVFR